MSDRERDAQRKEALDRGNRTRVNRAAMKKEIASGDLDWTEVLRDPPLHAMTMRIEDFLVVVPKIGEIKMHRLLQFTHVAGSRTLGNLTDHERHVIFGWLFDHTPGVMETTSAEPPSELQEEERR